jgi:hypothetical protein
MLIFYKGAKKFKIDSKYLYSFFYNMTIVCILDLLNNEFFSRSDQIRFDPTAYSDMYCNHFAYKKI